MQPTNPSYDKGIKRRKSQGYVAERGIVRRTSVDGTFVIE
jgi:hypothetical protein